MHYIDSGINYTHVHYQVSNTCYGILSYTTISPEFIITLTTERSYIYKLIKHVCIFQYERVFFQHAFSKVFFRNELDIKKMDDF